jgi:D-aspartate ligase
MNAPPGALVIGANLRALGIARSLGRRGIATWLLHEPGDDPVARLSRYAARTLPAPRGDGAQQAAGLLEIADRHGLRGWTLFATGDESAAAVARQRRALADRFAPVSPDWNAVSQAYSKRRTHELAQRIGVPHPRTWYPRTAAEVVGLDCPFPAIVKPDVKPHENRFTRAKAWRVDDRAVLLDTWRAAASLVGAEATMVQELVPGDGEAQYSFAALCHDGVPVAHLTARRARQYPRDFGHSSSLVETVDEPRVEELGRAVVAALRWTGLVEVEFKRDPRNGQYLLLDINPRVWTWHSIGARAGVDFPYLAWRLSQALPVAPLRASPGVRWVRLATDIPSAWGALRAGELTPLGWARSLQRPRQGALAAADDPLPSIVDPALVAWRTVRRAGAGSGRELVHRLRGSGDLLIGDARVHRQRDDPLGELFADREGLAARGGIRRRLVNRCRIVDRGRDPARGEVGA